MSRPSPWPALLPIFPELPGTFLLLSCFNLARSLVLIRSSWCRAVRSLDPVAPGVTPAAPPAAPSAAPPAASTTSAAPVPSRKELLMPLPRRPSVPRDRELSPKPNERARAHHLQALLPWPILRPCLLLNLSSSTSPGSRTVV